MSQSHYKPFYHGGLPLLFGPRTRDWSYDKGKLNFITPYILSTQMCRYASLIYRQYKPQVIWDMFGGIGSDTIELSNYFSVITTEIDPQVYALLKQNISTYRCPNVNILKGNCLTLLPIMKPDVIYFDPPWGENYKSKMKNFDFSQVFLDLPMIEGDPFLATIPKKVCCTDLIMYLYKNVTQNIVIKAPLNSNTFENIFPPTAIKYIFKSSPHNNLKFIYLIPSEQTSSSTIV